MNLHNSLEYAKILKNIISVSSDFDCSNFRDLKDVLDVKFVGWDCVDKKYSTKIKDSRFSHFGYPDVLVNNLNRTADHKAFVINFDVTAELNNGFKTNYSFAYLKNFTTKPKFDFEDNIHISKELLNMTVGVKEQYINNSSYLYIFNDQATMYDIFTSCLENHKEYFEKYSDTIKLKMFEDFKKYFNTLNENDKSIFLSKINFEKFKNFKILKN